MRQSLHICIFCGLCGGDGAIRLLSYVRRDTCFEEH